MNIIQRYRDWRHERLIRRHADACSACMDARDRAGATQHWLAMVLAVKARSPAQVARMESRMDFTVRRTIKRRVMDAFLRGRVPSSIVTAVFKLLRLRSL